MALVTMAFRRSDLPAAIADGGASGFLVPPVDGRTIKASTFSSNKWAWAGADPDLFLLRTSVGRHGDEGDLARDDADLVEISLGTSAPPWVSRPGPSPPPSPAGTRDCRSTRWATSTGSPGSGPPSAPCRASRCAERSTTGSASRPVSRAPGKARTRCSRDFERVRDPWPRPLISTRDNRHMTAPEKIPNAGKKAKDLNEVIRYTLWSVFKLKDVLPENRAGFADEVQELFDQLAAKDITVRGTYDVSGLRADADVMIWWHAETSDELQTAYNLFRRTRLGRALEPVWSNMALHRPAEFNKSHIPAFLADENPRDYVSVYPFVRSYDWYLLPDEDRRRMLKDHGMMARGYPDVRANTVASFSLGDYEWMLAFEADELYRIVDLMRHLRASEARMHVREEVPFYTGRRKSVADLVAGLA